MSGHEISDGTYAATVTMCTDDLIAFMPPSCEPAVLIAPDKILPQKELSPGDSVNITIAEEIIIDPKPGLE